MSAEGLMILDNLGDDFGLPFVQDAANRLGSSNPHMLLDRHHDLDGWHASCLQLINDLTAWKAATVSC